jgi:hypothetical protein
MRTKCLTVIFLLLVTRLYAEGLAVGEIKIDAPPAPVQPREYTMLLVHGLQDADLQKALVDWTPREGVVLLPFKTWGGQAVLLFSAAKPGKYAISITVNGWRQSTERAVEEAKAARIDAELLKMFEDVVAKLEVTYPYSLGSCVVEVAGTVPPTPTPTPTPTPGKKAVVILRETSESTPEMALLIAGLRNSPAMAAHDLLVLDKDSKTPEGQPVPMVQAYLRQLGSQKLPAIVIDVPGSYADDDVIYKGACPATAAEVVELLKQSGG